MEENSRRKKFTVSGTYSKFVRKEFDTAEEALAETTRLIEEGFTQVVVRDSEEDENYGWALDAI